MDHKPLRATSPTPLDARMVRTRTALRDALLVLLEQKPFDQITIRDIAAQSGTGYATFFRHYRDRTELLNDLAADQVAMLIELTFPVLFEADSSTTAEAVCGYVAERRALWTALLTGGAAGIVREEFIRQAGKLALAQGQKNSWLPHELGVIFGVCGTVEILAWWLKHLDEVPIKKIANILDRLILAQTWRPE
jgi:AcrR family transcriptional regulator